MPGKHSRDKGHNFERSIAQDFQDIGWSEARRHLEYQDGEAFGVDLKNTEPFRVQCKRYKDYAPLSKIEEIHIPNIDRDNYVPLLVTKRDRGETLVALPWNDFKKILRMAYQEG